jgi:flagellar basal body rod protein FlgG
LRRDPDGRLTDLTGKALQATGGGDILTGPGVPTILGDGTILIDGQAVGRIGIFQANRTDTAIDDLPEEVGEANVRQGFVVPSTVDPAVEMVELTKAGRLAETGARVFQIQDDLIGQVTAKLGGASA